MNVLPRYAYALGLLSMAGSLWAADGIQLLSKKWESGYTAKTVQQELDEHVLPGETVHNWTELVTRQLFVDPAARVPLDRLVQAVRRGFGPDCKDFTWKIVRQTEVAVLYVWTHGGCAKDPPQAEYSLIRRAPRGICRWAYATKKPPITEASGAALDQELAKQSCE
jgi:hypothetical protein